MRILVTGGSGFIGTNLISLLSDGHEVLNLDLCEPKIQEQKANWVRCDLLDFKGVKRVVADFLPEWVIHLAARTDLDETRDLEAYAVNFRGTEHLCEALDSVQSVVRVLFFSSMYVCMPGYMPVSDEDFRPHTLYGLSKQRMEELLRSRSHQYDWAIIRPTSIWGPYFSEPYAAFFNVVKRGHYMHPGERSCWKTYGYIGNLVYQIECLLHAPRVLKGQLYYAGDYEAYHIGEWADEIAASLGKKNPKVPFWIFKCAGWFGDVLKVFGIKFPMTSFRLRNMTTNNVLSTEKLKQIAPVLPFSRKQGVELTIAWIKECNL